MASHARVGESETLHATMGLVHDEAQSAQVRYGDFASMHEALGVLDEEFQELKLAIFMRQQNPHRSECVRKEAVQVAAVALRIAEQAGRVTR